MLSPQRHVAVDSPCSNGPSSSGRRGGASASHHDQNRSSGGGTSAQSKSYSEIREAYKIPNSGTLPPGITAGSRSSNAGSHNGDHPFNRSSGELNGPARSAGMRQDVISNAKAGTSRVHAVGNPGGRGGGGSRISMSFHGQTEAMAAAHTPCRVPSQRQHARPQHTTVPKRQQVGDGVGLQRRCTHDGNLPGLPGRGRAVTKRGSSGNSSESGDELDDSGPGTAKAGRRASTSAGLKSLPENKSFRGSFHPNNMDALQLSAHSHHGPSERPIPRKNLGSMTVEELQQELIQHGICVEGMYERNDLIIVCAQARQKSTNNPDFARAANSYRPVSQKNVTSSVDDINCQYRKRNGFDRGGDGNRRRGTSLDRAFDPGGHGNDLNNSYRNHQRRSRRRTIDSRDFGANPQQGMGTRDRLTLGGISTSHSACVNQANQGSGNLGHAVAAFRGGIVSCTSGSRPTNRRASNCGSDVSSMGDPDEDFPDCVRPDGMASRPNGMGGGPGLDGMGMAVYNAPLGTGMGSFGVEQRQANGHPNQQMGALLQQMQDLQNQTPPPQMLGHPMHQPQDQGWRTPGNPAISRRPTAGSARSGGSGKAGTNSGPSLNVSDGSGLGALSSRSNSFKSLSLRDIRSNSFKSQGQGGSLRDIVVSAGGNLHASGVSRRSAGSNGPHSELLTQRTDLEVQRANLDASSISETLHQGLHTRKKKKQVVTKKCVCIAAVVILLAGGGLAAGLVVLFVPDGEVDEGGGASLMNIRLPQSLSPSLSPTRILLEDPPSDIEGRCSPSNLPGSLSECKAACMPSACCYPGNSTHSCIEKGDNHNIRVCDQYRPYCDVIYDSWRGAEEGMLRTPLSRIVQMCMSGSGMETEIVGMKANTTSSEERLTEDGASEGIIISNITDSSNSTRTSTAERPSYFSERKRLRNHLRRELGDVEQRMEILGTQDHKICIQHCRASRCCHAPANTESLLLSASGVYTDATGGDYVVTNCQEESGQNRVLCEEYDKFCPHEDEGNGLPWEGLWSSIPTDAGDTTPHTSTPGMAWTGRPTSPSPTFSSLPSSGPSETSQPSYIQPSLPPTSSSSPTDSRLPSLASTNPTIQSNARPPATPLSVTPPLVASLADSTIAPETTPPSGIPSFSRTIPAGTDPSPPIAAANTLEIAAACSGDENVAAILSMTPSVRGKCAIACQGGLCCFSGDQTCHKGNEAACQEYYPCLVLVQDGNHDASSNAAEVEAPTADAEAPATTEKDVLPAPAEVEDTAEAVQAPFDAPPAPTQDLFLLCSADSMSTLEGMGRCVYACQAGSCCDVQKQGQDSCYFENQDVCDLYEPCMYLAGAGAPQGDVAAEKPDLTPMETAVHQGDTMAEEPGEQVPQGSMNQYSPSGSDGGVGPAEDNSQNDLPSPASADLAKACSYENLASRSAASIDMCYNLCKDGSCCLEGCLEEVCMTYLPCNNLNLLSGPPININEKCSGDSLADECASICSIVSCCFADGDGDSTNTESSSSSSCYVHFEETCLAYTPYCASMFAQKPIIEVPIAPENLAALCAFSEDFCEFSCAAALCCFEDPMSEDNCLSGNEEKCAGYSPCEAR